MKVYFCKLRLGSGIIFNGWNLETNKKLNVLVAAGGTGGHLFPAIAVIEQMEALTSGNVFPIFVGTADRIESKVVPSSGYEFQSIPISGYGGLFSLKIYLLPFKIILSIQKCREIIRKRKIDAVICTGAYISYPAGMAANFEKVPLFLLESNVSPGKTIKMLSSKARMIFTSFKETAKYFSNEKEYKILYLGNPIRKSILSVPEQAQARKNFGLDPNRRTVLIFGGSLGARSINNAVEKAIVRFKDSDFQILWQTGNNFTQPVTLPENIKVLPFIEDMASAYSAADLVVSRSGATTVAEICAVGKPSILIPLPSASNNEQELNAKVLEKQYAAFLLDNDVLDTKLGNIILKFMSDGEILQKMGESAKSL
ncbi:MAG: undecaprenyldiphospho-muramoylpentapeptide beta-N-acetylglucosaminyltransferase, partial [FCB group bacterium]